MTPHLLFAITPHGFGHAAMIAPVINALGARHPEWRITLRTTLPPEFLASRITAHYLLDKTADDFGMVQRNALEIDIDASARRYLQLHHHWDAAVERVAGELRARQVDLVVSDIPYLTLAAAQQERIINVALSCLHWGDIYAHYCLDRPEGREIHGQIMTAYRNAGCFIRTEPAMPMEDLDNVQTIGPIAVAGRQRRAELVARLGLAADERLVLVSMGGISFRLPMEQWQHLPRVRYIVPRDWQIAHDDCIVFDSLGMPFGDVLASCDLLLTKPGYGSFSEAAINGTPVLYVPRRDWPESPWLIDWLERHGHCAAIERTQLERGEILAAMESLLARGRPVPVSLHGVEQAVAIIESVAGRS